MSFESQPIVAPFQGIVDNVPAPYKDPRSWDDLLNMWVYQGRLITRPRLTNVSNVPDGAIIWNIIPFFDILGNLHNLALTANSAWMLTSDPVTDAVVWNGPLFTPAWSSSVTYAANDLVVFNGGTYFSIIGSTNLEPDLNPTQWGALNGNVVNSALPWGYELAQGRVYFGNGSVPGLYSDGEATIKSMLHPGSFRFIQTLAQHMVTAYTTEPPPQVRGSQVFPYRVRWSDSGNPTVWTESPATSAGHQDLLDVGDYLTGFTTNGRSGFVWRTDGVTMMTPTGVGSAPFQFDQVAHAPKGVGNYYPYSLATYDVISAFVSEENVFTFGSSSFTPIGTSIAKKLYADIGTTTSDRVIGTIIGRFNPMFKYLSYWISIPSSVDGFPVTWIYSWENKSWQRFRNTQYGRLTTIANMVL